MFEGLISKKAMTIFLSALSTLSPDDRNPLKMSDVYHIQGEDAAWVQEVGQVPFKAFGLVLLLKQQSKDGWQFDLDKVEDAAMLTELSQTVWYWEEAMGSMTFAWKDHPNFKKLDGVDYADKVKKGLAILQDQERLYDELSTFRRRIEKRLKALGHDPTTQYAYEDE